MFGWYHKLFGLGSKLDEITRALRQVNQKLEKIMATQAEFTAAFARIDTATTAIAAKLRDLAGQIGSMTTEEEDAAKLQLEGVAASLEAMAVTPTDPIPVPVPENPEI